MKKKRGTALLLLAVALAGCSEKPNELVLSHIPAVINTLGGDGLKGIATCAAAEAAGYVVLKGPQPTINNGVIWREAKSKDDAIRGYCYQPLG